MIYIIINIAIAIYLIQTAFNINTKNLKNENMFINIVLLAAALALFRGLTIFMTGTGHNQLAIFFEHCVLMFFGILYIMISFYILSQGFKNNIVMIIIKYVLIAFAVYISVQKVKIIADKRLILTSGFVFGDEFGKIYPLKWFQFYYGIFIFLVPAFSALTFMVYAENSGSRLLFQRSIFFGATLLFSWFGFATLILATRVIRMAVLLFPLVVTIMLSIMKNVAKQDKIYDGLTLFSSFIFNFIRYAFPSILGAFSFVSLRPFYEKSHTLYFVVVFLIILFVSLAAYILERLALKISSFTLSQYGTLFEADLAAIDYNDETADICQKFYSIFQNRVGVDKMKILIAGGNEELNTVFASDGNNVMLSVNDEGLEVIRTEGLNIFLRDEIQTRFSLQLKSKEINKFLTALDAEVLIILNEGRHLIGIIALGTKRGGASYDEYDKEVFDKLYSYFFVFGYYMSNIANASVVGTVNREIRMSAQIIKSIQENMDFLKNPKIDVGYLMVPAHNIGGEFVDLIRLSETRHIFVVGSMSGKGISASMSMVILKSIIRTLLTTTHDFKKLVSKVNEFIRFGLPKGTFFAGVFCLVDFETDTLYYINCGIPTMLLYTRSFNNVIEIQGSGFVLGFAKDVTPLLKVKQMKLNPGDVLAITTAGIINSHSLRGELYGKDRIRQSMTDNYMYDGMHMAEFLFDDLKRFLAKELDEDVTVLMMRYLDKDTQTVSNGDEDEVKIEEEPVVEQPSGPIVLEAL